MTSCPGCGGTVPQPERGRRKWCSERCRKAQYSTPCVDCGAPTNGSDGHGDRASQRCPACANARRIAAQREGHDRLARRIVAMWAEGMTSGEIAEALGWQRSSMQPFISALRAQGYDLPHRRPAMVANGKRLAEDKRRSLAAAA